MKRVYADPTAHLGRASQGDYASSVWHDLALSALRLRRDGPRGELLLLAAQAPSVLPADHQIAGAVAILERMGSCALLADDEALDPVGTAALVVREWAVRHDSPSLILAPASRAALWRRALVGLQGRLAPTVLLHGQAEAALARGWENVVLDGAHQAITQPRLQIASKRRLLVTSTPIRTGLQDLIPLLGMLGSTPDPAGLRRHALRRTAKPRTRALLAEIVRLDPTPTERSLADEARELAVSAIPSGGGSAAAWRNLLQAASSLPQAPFAVATQALAADPDPLGRARILSLLRLAHACCQHSPGKFEALIPLVAGAAGRTLVCVSSVEAAAWLRHALASRGLDVAPHGKVWAIADGDPQRVEPAGLETIIHLDVPWDPRCLAERLERLDRTTDLRSFHLTLADTVEEQLLCAYQDGLALAAPLGTVASAVAEAPDDPEVAVGAAVVAGAGAFAGWAATLRECLELSRQAALATSRAIGDLELSGD